MSGIALYKLWFFLFFCGFGLILPQLSPFAYQYLGDSSPGLLFMAGQFSLPAGSLLAALISDKTLLVGPIKTAASLLAALATAAFSLPVILGLDLPGYVAIASWSLFTFALGGILPVINVSYLQSGLPREKFGQVRLFGTLGFLIVNAILMFFKTEPPFLILAAVPMILISMLVVKHLPTKRLVSSPERFSVKEASRLLLSKPLLFFILIMFLFAFQFAPAEHIIGEHVKQIPFWVEPIPAAWLLGTSVEVLFFFVSPWLARHVSPTLIIALGFTAGLLRYLALLYLPDDSAGRIIAQALHGLHFGGAFFGTVLLLESKTPARYLGSAQALYLVFARSAGTGLGAFYLGNLADSGDFHLVWQASLFIGLAGLGLLFLFHFYQRGRNFTGP